MNALTKFQGESSTPIPWQEFFQSSAVNGPALRLVGLFAADSKDTLERNNNIKIKSKKRKEKKRKEKKIKEGRRDWVLYSFKSN